MTLMLKLTRAAARFELTDDDAETVVSITEQDDQDTLLRKLKRVVALVEGERAPRLHVLPPGTEVIHMDPPVQTGNGWAAMAPPEIPEGADYELIPPGEEA